MGNCVCITNNRYYSTMIELLSGYQNNKWRSCNMISGNDVLSVYPNFSDKEIKEFLREREKIINPKIRTKELSKKEISELEKYVDELTIKTYNDLIISSRYN